jgi:hypothetical protein
MVKKYGFVLFIVLTQVSCSWWGEKAPPPQTIEVKPHESRCADATEIFEGTEEKSRQTLDCWKDELTQLWTQVEGQAPDSLTGEEIATLIRKHAVEITHDPEEGVKLILALKDLLGFESVQKDKYDALLEWITQNRQTLRELYLRFMRPGVPLSYTDLKELARVLQSFSRVVNWKMSSEVLGQKLGDLFRPKSYIAHALIPASRVAHDVLGFVCPLSGQPGEWSPSVLANCAEQFSAFFEPAAAWFEFLFNRVTSISEDEINQALARMPALIESWFQNPGLQGLPTRQWVRLMQSLEIDVGDDFVDSLKWIRKFKGKSTEELIDPTAMIRIFKIIEKDQRDLIETIPLYQRAIQNGLCLAPATYWTDCRMPADGIGKSQVGAFRKLARVISLQSGFTKGPRFGITGGEAAFVYLFDAVSIEVVNAFASDPKEGLVSTNTGDENDEVTQVLTAALKFCDQVDKVLTNLKRHLAGLPPVKHTEIISFQSLDLKGLARLTTITSEVMVHRTKKEKSVLDGLIANLTNSFPKSTVHLDHWSMTAILNQVWRLSDYRESYLTHSIHQEPSDETDEIFISRTDVLRELPALVEEHFPRTFASCKKFGYEKSCGAVFEELLSGVIPGTDLLTAGDLDGLTLVATTLEGLLDHCDDNGDGKLQADLFDGNDELDCTVTRSKDIALRLMESKILKASDGDRTQTELLLESANSVFFTRIPAKLALIRGTKSGNVIRIPVGWAYRTATLGSVYGLLADIIRKD